MRPIEKRLDEIGREMQRLPEVREHLWGSRYGHRSADLPDEATADWVQLDLDGQRMVDMVALMTANLSYRGEEGAGYGFPKRFRVAIADNPDMRDAVVVVDRSNSDVANPGRYPLVFEFKPVAGRYVRMYEKLHVPTNTGAVAKALREKLI